MAARGDWVANNVLSALLHADMQLVTLGHTQQLTALSAAPFCNGCNVDRARTVLAVVTLGPVVHFGAPYVETEAHNQRRSRFVKAPCPAQRAPSFGHRALSTASSTASYLLGKCTVSMGDGKLRP